MNRNSNKLTPYSFADFLNQNFINRKKVGLVTISEISNSQEARKIDRLLKRFSKKHVPIDREFYQFFVSEFLKKIEKLNDSKIYIPNSLK